MVDVKRYTSTSPLQDRKRQKMWKVYSFLKNGTTLTLPMTQANIALQTSQNEETNRILSTLTYHPQILAVKNVTLKNFKILRKYLELNTYLLYQHLFHSNAAKYIDHFLVRSTFKSENQPETLKCKRTRCKTRPFVSNIVKISGPNRYNHAFP